jgi:hypothetical protein
MGDSALPVSSSVLGQFLLDLLYVNAKQHNITGVYILSIVMQAEILMSGGRKRHIVLSITGGNSVRVSCHDCQLDAMDSSGWRARYCSKKHTQGVVLTDLQSFLDCQNVSLSHTHSLSVCTAVKSTDRNWKGKKKKKPTVCSKDSSFSPSISPSSTP